MTSLNATISTEYDALAFEENDLADLRVALNALGPTRIRPAYKERGGIDTTLWMTVSWIGIAAASGIVGHIATKHYEKILAVFRDLYKKHSTQENKYAQAVALKLSHDDLDIEINLPGETRSDFLDGICTTILQHLQTEPLLSANVTKLYIPFFYDEEESKWRQTYVWSQADFNMRFWGYAAHGYPVVDGIYDSLERRTIEVSYDDFE